MHNLKELTGKFIVAIVIPKKEYNKISIKGREETMNVVKEIPDEPLETLIHSILGESSPVLPIRIGA